MNYTVAEEYEEAGYCIQPFIYIVEAKDGEIHLGKFYFTTEKEADLFIAKLLIIDYYGEGGLDLKLLFEEWGLLHDKIHRQSLIRKCLSLETIDELIHYFRKTDVKDNLFVPYNLFNNLIYEGWKDIIGNQSLMLKATIEQFSK